MIEGAQVALVSQPCPITEMLVVELGLRHSWWPGFGRCAASGSSHPLTRSTLLRAHSALPDPGLSRRAALGGVMTTAAHHHRPVRLLAVASGGLILILALAAAASPSLTRGAAAG